MTNRKLKKLLSKHNQKIPAQAKYSVHYPFKKWAEMSRYNKDSLKKFLESSHDLQISKPIFCKKTKYTLSAIFEYTYQSNLN